MQSTNQWFVLIIRHHNFQDLQILCVQLKYLWKVSKFMTMKETAHISGCVWGALENLFIL